MRTAGASPTPYDNKAINTPTNYKKKLSGYLYTCKLHFLACDLKSVNEARRI